MSKELFEESSKCKNKKKEARRKKKQEEKRTLNRKIGMESLDIRLLDIRRLSPHLRWGGEGVRQLLFPPQEYVSGIGVLLSPKKARSSQLVQFITEFRKKERFSKNSSFL